MKVLNVFVEKSRLTQFHGINQIHITDGILINLWNSYNICIRNGELDTNIDIFLVGHHNTYLELSEYQHLLKNRLVYVKQHKKSSILASINSVVTCPKYISANIHGCFNPHEDWSEYIFEPAVYYVKPEYGARSLNQFIIDSSKVSLGHFLNQLKNFDESKDEQAKFLTNLVAQANGHIKHIKGHERFENEHASLKSSFCVHECITDVVKEYRVICFGFGEKQYFFERTRNEANDGVTSNEIEYALLDQAAHPDIQDGLREALGVLQIFHGALDVVVTSDGRWSIIEISNQYGGADIPPQVKLNIIQETLQHLIRHANIYTK